MTTDKKPNIVIDQAVLKGFSVKNVKDSDGDVLTKISFERDCELADAEKLIEAGVPIKGEAMIFAFSGSDDAGPFEYAKQKDCTISAMSLVVDDGGGVTLKCVVAVTMNIESTASLLLLLAPQIKRVCTATGYVMQGEMDF